MIVLSVILLVISVLATTADLILQSSYKIKNFGIEKTWLNFKGKTVPIEDFFPHDVRDSLIFALIFSFVSLILSILTMPAMATVFCGIIFAGCGLFWGKRLWVTFVKRIEKKVLPSDRPDAGDYAVCKEKIEGSLYGVITFKYKGDSYDFTAFSVNETDIEVGERVIVVDKEQGAVWVERVDEELKEVEE